MTKTLMTGIAAAIALSMTANAEGDGKKGPRDGKRPGGPHPELLKKFDKDGDGKLNEEERAAAKEAMEARRAAFIKKHDTDGDGKLSDEEKKAAREAIAAKRKEIHAAVLKEFDKDGDGKLSEEERKGVREWVKENYPDAGPMVGPPAKRGPGKGKGGPGPRGKGKPKRGPGAQD
ncbi:MAG: hypothetical protein H7A51_08905 [Akkermansiaceae bacterium]|nr:hypothetical protein [Akkermansiaceae bacterium]